MSQNIDQQTLNIEATINQLLSGLEKTYVPFTDAELWANKHLDFSQRLEAVCNQDYQLNIRATKIISQFGWKWLEVENLGKNHYFPDIVV